MLKKPAYKIALNPFLFVLIFANLFVSCSSIDHKVKPTPKNQTGFFDHNIKEIPKNHILMFNAKGNPLDPCSFENEGRPRKKNALNDNPNICKDIQKAVWPYEYKPQNEDEFNYHVELIFKGITQHFEKPENKDKEKKILFYVHGGLNTRSGALQRVVDPLWGKPLYEEIMNEGYYPIFINWDSGLVSTYGDHLFNIRQGEDSDWGFISAPIYFGIDVARSIVRAPLVISSFLTNDLKTTKNIEEKFFDTTAIEIADSISEKPDPDPKICDETQTPLKQEEGKINVYRGEDCRTPTEENLYSAVYAGTFLFPKLPAMPFIDGFGTSAWANMLRRVQLLYNSDREYHSYKRDHSKPKEGNLYKSGSKDYLNIPLSGGLSRFMQKFIQKFQKDLDQKGEDGEKKKEMQLTLVGHSTGSNVLNELIRNFGEIEQKNGKEPLTLPIETIVYMAAASTVSHFQSTVHPYLLQNKDTNFYNLTLGRQAEIRDEYAGLTPRGSLLVWIDEFLTNPLTHRERTLGRFDNFMLTAHEIPYSIRNRIHLKTYSTGTTGSVGEKNPQHHSDFGQKIKFWKKECWKTTSTNCYKK